MVIEQIELFKLISCLPKSQIFTDKLELVNK